MADICSMFSHPVVKPAFHLSWFLLILGGISLFEKAGWGLIGGVMFFTGLVVMIYTAIAIYLKKPIIKEPGWLLLLSSAMILVLVIAELITGKFMLAAVIVFLMVPILLGWAKIKGKKSTPKKSTKR